MKEFFMKKISRTIATVLILIMLASSFTSCKSIPADGAGYLLGIGLLALIVLISLIADTPNETGIYLASTENNSLAQYYSAMEILNSLPEKEKAFLMEKINSLPKTKHADLVRAINALPEAEIASSIERLTALSKTELISEVRAFNSLSEAEFHTLMKELIERAKSFPKTEYTDVVAFSHQNASMALCFQY
jgi:hypothetical protein